MTTRPAEPAAPGTGAHAQGHAAHLRAWNQIPWLVAGSASAADAAAFEQHAAACDECRAELDFQRQVQAAMQASALPAHHAEPALRRLQARIAVENSVAPKLVPPQPRGAPARHANWTRAWAFVALLQAVGLVLLGSLLWSRSDDNAYRTLTSPPHPPSAASAGLPAATIRLVLSPQLSAGQMQALLRRHRLAAVEISADGASLGLVALDAAGAATQPAAPAAEIAAQIAARIAAQIAAHIAALRAEPGVLLAEPIVNPAPTR